MRTGVNRGDRKIQWCVGFSRIPLGVKEIAPGGRGHGGPFPYPNPHLLSAVPFQGGGGGFTNGC